MGSTGLAITGQLVLAIGIIAVALNEWLKRRHERRLRLDDKRKDIYVAALISTEHALHGRTGIPIDNRKAIRDCLFAIDLYSTAPVRIAAHDFLEWASKVEGLKEKPEESGFGADDQKKLWALHDAFIEAARKEQGVS